MDIQIIHDLIEQKEKTLAKVVDMQMEDPINVTGDYEDYMAELCKNENEVKAQVKLLYHIYNL